MNEDPTLDPVANARAAAQAARLLSDEHQRANRHADPGDAAIRHRGDELKRLATEASAQLDMTRQQTRAAAAVRRTQANIAHDAQLQSQLRAEAQARREATAAAGPPPRRRGYR
jgi:hypothetical protein